MPARFPSPPTSPRRSLDDRARAARALRRRAAACGCSASRCRSSSTRPRSQQGVLVSTTTPRATHAANERRAAVERATDAVRDRFGDRRGRTRRSLARRRRAADDRDRARRVRPHRHRARVRAPAARRGRARSTRRSTATYDADPERGRARSRGTTAASRAASLAELVAAVDVGVGLHVDGRATSKRSSARSTRAAGVLREAARARPRRLRARRGAARTGAAPGRPRAAVVAGVRARGRDHRERRATAGRWRRSCATTSTSRSRASTARRGARTSRTPAAARSSSTRSTTSTCCTGCSATPCRSAARRRHRFGHPGIEDTAAVTFALRRRFGGAAHERLAPGAVPGVEPPARGLLRGRALWTDDDYLGPAPRADQRRRPRSSASCPSGPGRLTVARGVRQVDRPLRHRRQGVPRRASPHRAAAPSGIPEPARRCRAPLVDQAYRSAAAGGAPESRGGRR